MVSFMLILAQLIFFKQQKSRGKKKFFYGKSPNLPMLATVLIL